jgi:hypothetical protein
MNRIAAGCVVLFLILAVLIPPVAADQSEGAWVFERFEKKEENGKGGHGYYGQIIEINPGGASARANWQWGEGSSGRWTGSAKWTSPPKVLTPGQKVILTITCKSSEQASKGGPRNCGNRVQFGVERRYIDGEHAGWSSDPEVCSAHGNESDTVSITWIVSSRTGGLIVPTFSYWGTGGSSSIKYVYRWVDETTTITTSSSTTSTTTTTTTAPPSEESKLCGLAINKPARQSSTYSDAVAGRAVDGNTDGDYWKGNSVSHTDIQEEAWWEVDLETLCQVDFLYLWNRTDCCGERLSDFYILVSENPFPEEKLEVFLDDSDIWRLRYNGQAPEKRRIDVNWKGRYIRIQLIGRNYLAIAEVDVCGWAVEAPIKPPPVPPQESEDTKRPGEEEVVSKIIGRIRNCTPDWGHFQVPRGRQAAHFRYGGLVSGYSCDAGEKVLRKGFTIHRADDNSTRVYSYSINEEGRFFEPFGPLAELVLNPGSYFVSVDGGYAAEVKVFYKLVPPGSQ